jgi:hypothetical protein
MPDEQIRSTFDRAAEDVSAEKKEPS